ncbi:MAG: hypothetical protein H7099_09380 [Gemmatimonadaceae bacterium]|nr:hypothetical protein [Gemmatimonadaceae bacterium]
MMLARAVAAQDAAAVRYSLRFDQGDSAGVAVSITLPTPIAAPIDFAMPRSIPMGYGTQPYDRFVSDLVARDANGAKLAITDLDGPRWRIASSAGHALASIEYRVDVRRMESAILNAGDASRVRPGYLGLLGYSVFGFVDAVLDAPITLDVRVPTGWPVYSTLSATPSRGAIMVHARDFYALADAQILAGPDLVLQQVSHGVPFTLALYSEQQGFDIKAMGVLADSALRQTIAYFGTTPLSRYTASIEILTPLSQQHEYRFSMEHLESATYRFAVGQLDAGPAGRDRTYYNLLHHTVHSWLPKQCAPAGYYPFTWDYAAPIDGIWFSEGWAQYIAADIFGGPGVDGAERRRARVALRFDGAAADTLPPIRGHRTAELSRVAAHQYSEDFRISATVFSRGALMAGAIDDRIRQVTHDRKSLRDVTRGLMSWCETSRAPVTADVIGRVVNERTGVDARDLIDSWLAPRGARAPDRARP